MKSFRFLLFLAIFFYLFTACSKNSVNDKTPESKIRKKAIAIAETYASAQLNNARKEVSRTGVITINDNQKRYIIDPARVFTGFIDNDSKKDALVSVISVRGQELDQIEHLVILNTDGKLMLIKSIESDIKILELKDRVITAEIHTRPRNSPLYYCSSCMEIAKYQYKDGDLVKIEK
jgi:hypothetical protein